MIKDSEIQDLKYKKIDDYITPDGGHLLVYEVTFKYADRKGIMYFMAAEELMEDSYVSLDDIMKHQASRWVEDNL